MPHETGAVGGEGPDAPLIATGYALDGSSGSIGLARRHAVDFLQRVSSLDKVTVSERAVELTQLVVSELVTNVLKYAPGPGLMELRVAAGSVEVTVWDSHCVGLTPRAADAERVGQHGLEIVVAVSESVEVELQPVGKRVIARIALGNQFV